VARDWGVGKRHSLVIPAKAGISPVQLYARARSRPSPGWRF